MSSRTTFRLMFYINRSRPNKSGECPINMRITINGKSLAIFTKRYVTPDLWEGKLGVCRGKSNMATEVNRYLEDFKANAYNKYSELNGLYDHCTPELMRDAILCINTSKSRSLCIIWDDHLVDLKLMIGKETSYGNYHKYKTALRYMRQFLLEELNVPDVPIKLVNRHMVVKFELFLRTKKMCCHNTTMKYLQNFKRIVRIGMQNGWLKINPFADFKLTLREVDRPYLTETELQSIMDLEILMPRLELVRDLFVFASFSGLSYADLFKLKGSELEQDNKGVLWIKTRRQKTKSKSQVPLLHVPTFIIEKYCDLSILKAEDKVLPVLSNQKINAYLKEIQTLAKIEKTLTFHVARHTFATTVTMMNGVPIESVARMMGHKNIRTTQHYARIVDSKIGNDMNELASKIGARLSISPAMRNQVGLING
jgi:integrase